MATSLERNPYPWWLTNRKVVDKNVKEARALVTTQSQSDIASALNLLEATLSLYPRHESALELKARALLFIRRYADVADMLRDYIPSHAKIADSDESSDSLSSNLKEQVKLLSSSERESSSLKCFSVSGLKRMVMAGLCKNYHKEGHWRYLVLGQACLHLGLMEDALLLLQAGKRLDAASLRHFSTSCSDDNFPFFRLPISSENRPPPPPKTEIENISPLITHIKQMLRRKTAALATLDAGLYSESIRHFSKILDSRRGGPQAFLTECYIYRATAYKFLNKIADSIADCNKALSLDPSSLEALTTRATLFESIRCLPESLHDLEHLKLLYNSILRDKKLPGPVWKKTKFCYSEIPGKLCALGVKIHELKSRVSKGETANVDYYALIGLRRGCSRSELCKMHILLTLRHKPDRSNGFLERCEFVDERDVSPVRERAKVSALLLYRLIQKGYTSLMAIALEEEIVEKQRIKAKAALQAAMEEAQKKQIKAEAKKMENKALEYQGVFCRDIAVVGNLLSQTGFNLPIPLKYEALSC